MLDIFEFLCATEILEFFANILAFFYNILAILFGWPKWNVNSDDDNSNAQG